MPNALLSVPHFKQTKDGMCLPACVRMVLAYLGQTVTETAIAKHLQTKSFGTPISNVKRLEQWQYQVKFGSLAFEQLQFELEAKRPVIVRFWTVMLDYWQTDTSHVAVVVGVDDHQVYLNDPAFKQYPIAVSYDGFLAAWAEFDETAAVIYR